LKFEKQKGETGMTKRIVILAMALCMSVVLANRMTAVALAQSQDNKMESNDKMKDDKMAGHDKMAKKDKMHKKGKMSKSKMKHDKMKKQDKMEQPQ
jgi:pentapeptide MXKDX repeat protein